MSEWEDITNLDYYTDIQKKIPGIRIGSGYRTPAYQEEMKRRGYHPADNSGHLRGEKMDFTHPKGQAWLQQQIKRIYPEARINPESDHLDVSFPGYNKAPATEGAAAEGITNPNRTALDDWEVIDDSPVTPKGKHGSVTIEDEHPDELAPTETVARFWDDPTPPQPLDPRIEAGYADVLKHGTADQIRAYAKANGFDIKENPDFIRQRDIEHKDVGPVPYASGKPVEAVQPESGVIPRGLANAPLSGLLDEIGAVADSLGATDDRENIFNTDKRWADLWLQNQTLNKQIIEGDRAEHPYQAYGSELLGGALVPFGNKASTLPELLGVGAGFGAATAVGEGEGTNRFTDAPVAAAEGALFTAGLGKAFQAIAKKWGGKIVETEHGPAVDVEGTVRQPTIDDVNEAWEGPVPDFLKQSAKPRKGAKPLPEPKVATATPKAAPEVKANPKVKTAEGEVKRVSEGWKNAPEYHVVDDLKELPPEVRQQVQEDGVQDKALGLYHEGKAYIFANNVDDPADITAAVFHESLGHHGLNQLFQEKLDSELLRLYKGNKQLREATDARSGTNLYGDADNPLARHVEEALAARSEKGQVFQSYYDKMAVFVRQLARRMGANLDISDREVKAILSQTHARVVNGKPGIGGSSGVRYMYVGEKADKTDKNALKDAKTADFHGMGNVIDNYKDTGWFEGPDKKWRTEIDDSGADLMPHWQGGQTLGEILHHPELFKRYPEFKDIQVQTDSGANGRGWYNPESNTIGIDPNDREPLSVLLHEIQHLIQNKEGFARGGSPAGVFRQMGKPEQMKVLDKVYKEADQKLSDYDFRLSNLELAKKIHETDSDFREWRKAYDQYNNHKPKVAGEDSEAGKIARQERNKLYEKVRELDRRMSEKFTGYDDLFQAKKTGKISEEEFNQLADLMTAIKFSSNIPSSIRSTKKLMEYVADDIAKMREFASGTFKDKEKMQHDIERIVGRSEQSFRSYEQIFGEIEARDTQARQGMSMKERRDTVPYNSQNHMSAEDVLISTDRGGGKSMSSDEPIDFEKEAQKRLLKKLGAGPKLIHDIMNTDISFVPKEIIDNSQSFGMEQIEDILERAERGEKIDLQEELKKAGKTPSNDNKYMLKGDKRTAEAISDDKAGNINLAHIKSTKDIEGYIRDAVAKTTPIHETHEDIIDFAKTLQLSPKEMKAFADDMEELPGKMTAMRSIYTTAANKLATTASKIAEGGENSDITRHEFLEDLVKFNALTESFSRAVGASGRLLNSFNIDVKGKVGRAADIRMMMKEMPTEVLQSAESIDKLARMIHENPGKAGKIAKDAMQKVPSDYFFSLYYNSMLSNPATHALNAMGTVAHLGLDNVMRAIAHPTEMLPRLYGSIVGLRTSLFNTPHLLTAIEKMRKAELLSAGSHLAQALWGSPVRKSFAEGVPLHKISRAEISHNIMPGPLKVLETPSRALAAADEFFRNIIIQGDYYTKAFREAKSEGLKGKEFYEYVDMRAKNPTPNMVNDADEYARMIQFMDDPSIFASGLEKFRSRKAGDDAFKASVRNVTRVIIPFVRTLDSVTRTMLRNTGVVGTFERYNKADFKSDKKMAATRLVLGQMLTAAAFMKASDGLVTGAGPEDYKKRQELEAGGWQANSIRVGDKWISLKGLEPVSLLITGPATIHERLAAGELKGDGLTGQVKNALGGFLAVMRDNNWFSSLNVVGQLLQDGPMQDTAMDRLVDGFAVSMMPMSGFNRGMTQVLDKKVYDTSESLEDKIRAGLYPQEGDLPQRHDVYGRPVERGDKLGPDVFSRMTIKEKETDPAVNELQRLSKDMSGVLVGPAEKTITLTNDEDDADDNVDMKLDSKEYQEYQRLSGQYILETVRERMNNGEWKGLTDAEKRKDVKAISTEMRKAAREELFTNQWESVE